MKVACHLSEGVEQLLARHASQPQLLPYVRQGALPWEVPAEAEGLFTFAMGWRNAPAQAPAGWPFGLQHVQIAAGGVDAFPRWFFDGLTVSSGRGIAAVPIAEYVLMAMLAREKRWDETRARARADWQLMTLGQLEGRTLGLIGVGAIGMEVARRAQAFGMRVIGLRRGAAGGTEGPVTLVPTLEALLAQSDHAVVAVPLTASTRGLVGRQALAAAKPTLHLINVSRGEVVDDAALAEAVREGRIAGATLDVTSPEPLPDGHPFYGLDAIRITPHLSWSSQNGDERIAAKLLDNLDRHLRGEPMRDIVDPDRGY